MKNFWVLIAILFWTLLMAESPQKCTVEALMQLKAPWAFDVSGDGEWFVFSIRTPDFTESRWQYHLWLAGKQEKPPRQLTYSSARDYSPRFSRDGQFILFLSSRPSHSPQGEEVKGVPQIWALPLRGGEARQISSLENGVQFFELSPGGKVLYAISDENLPEEVKQKNERRKKLKFDGEVKDSVKVNKVLWQIRWQNGDARRIAVLDPGVEEITVAPDNQWVVYQTNYTGDFNDEQKYDLWAVNVLNGEKVQLTGFPGPEIHPAVSPDGRWLAYIKQTTPDVEFAETDLARMPFTPGHANSDTVNLTRDFNRSVLDFQWHSNSRDFYLRVADGTETKLYRFRPEKKKRRYEWLTREGGNVLDFHVLPKGKLYYLWENATHLPEVVQFHKKKSRVLTDFSRQLDSLDLGIQKVYKWKSVDGKEIEGLLFLPSRFDSTRKYPLILTVHGGPYGRFRQAVRQAYYTQVYTSDGYVVLAPNPRGSSGYDDAFGKAIWYKHGGHMGGIDYQDIMAGVDALIAEGFVDENRMGVIGGSYGGYLTNWIITQTNRFAAAVSQFGIFSLFTDWSNSWQPLWEKMYLGIYYWEQPIGPEHPYVKYSPAFYVTNIHTPVLILHGEHDRYTNLANSQEMYQALKTLGREVKFVVYPREGHGLGREPNHRRDVVHRSKKWFDHYLKGK